MKKLVYIVVGLAVAVGAYIGIDAVVVTDSEEVQAVIDQACRAIEKEDEKLCMSYVADDFRTDRGEPKGRLARLARWTFRTFDNIKVIVNECEVSVSERKAKVHITFRLLGDYQGRRAFILGEPLHTASASLHFEKRPGPAGRKGRWLLVGVSQFHPGWKMPGVSRKSR